MKEALLLIGILLSSSVTFAQSINCKWADFSDGEGNHLESIDNDANNNTFIIGNFRDLILGSYSLTTQNTLSYSRTFVAKYNLSGEIEWLNQYGDVESTRGSFIKCDEENNVLFALEYSDSINVNGTSYYASGYRENVILVKLDNDGQVLWVREIKSEATLKIRSLDVMGNGKIVVLIDGSQNDTTYFESLSGRGNRLLASYDKNGKITWLKELTGWIQNSGDDPLVANESGDIYFTGIFSDSITYANTTIVAKGYWYVDYWKDSSYVQTHDFFLAKMDSLGNEIWITTIGTAGYESGQHLATYDDAIFVVGKYSDSSFLGLQNPIFSDGSFLLKYSTDGVLLNYKKISDDFEASNNTFGDINCNDQHVLLTGKRNDDIFLDKYDWDLNKLHSLETGGYNFDYGTSVNINDENDILLGGSFINEVAFGDCETYDRPLFKFNLFLVKLNNNFVPVESISNLEYVKLYPNPIVDKLHIIMKNNKNEMSVRLIDINGRTVVSQHFKAQTSNERCINMAKLSEGIYIVEIRSENNVFAEQVVKK